MDSLHELGYQVDFRIIDAKPWVPQHRERIFIVGFRDPSAFRMDLVSVPKSEPLLGDILHPEDGSEEPEDPYTTGKQRSSGALQVDQAFVAIPAGYKRSTPPQVTGLVSDW